MANSLVAVQKDHICNAVKYIILNAQRPDGRFIETGGMYHKEMIVCAPFWIQYCPHNTLNTGLKGMKDAFLCFTSG